MDLAATIALTRRARRLLIKVGQETLRVDTQQTPLTGAEIRAHLIHADGFLRVPVLVLGDVLVRGYTEELYGEALEGPCRR
ncbi:MAG: hypothetical protein ACE5JN_13010 [Candidatus Methylomirabilia bacterium]